MRLKIAVLICVMTLVTDLAASAGTAFVEFPLSLTTRHSPARYTELVPGFGVGWTHFAWSHASFRFGYSALFQLAPLWRQGTGEVNASGFETVLQGRALAAYAFDGSIVSFWPYLYVAPETSVNFTRLRAFASEETVVAPRAGFQSGGGLQICLGDFALKIDSSVGVLSTRLQLRSWIIFGFGIF